MHTSLKGALLASCAIFAGSFSAQARTFDIPKGDLERALDTYTAQTGLDIVVSTAQMRGVRSRGASGNLTDDAALSHILAGTGFVVRQHPGGAIGIVRDVPKQHSEVLPVAPARMASTVAAAAGVESVIVTSSKIKGDIQTVPIAITALSQEQLTERQIAGGPDLVKEVPNLTFTKTNFTGYNLQIRGIGTQAISVTIDPAVAVAFNDTPFLRNHFFEQEFYDLSQAEVLRGPQGTLYGRNANAGVVNLISAKPTDQFEAALSADFGNYRNRRYEGMVNIPITDDKLALRVAGEWTKRDGYSFNETTNSPIDGRDLWSTRATLRWKPIESITADVVWEHFEEHDDRLRSGKQLCKTDPGPTSFTTATGSTIPVPPSTNVTFGVNAANFSQGCLPDSLYDKGDPAHGDYGNFGVPNGYSLPFLSGIGYLGALNLGVDPYSQVRQSTNLRDIQSTIDPIYKAKNDTVELNAEWNISPAFTFFSNTGYNNDFLWSVEDYNRFDTSPGVFAYQPGFPTTYMTLDPNFPPHPGYPGGAIVCDPQLGCSSRVVVEDLSTETAWQASQEFRLASNFEGPLNFSAGVNYLHYETVEKYYVFSNSFTIFSLSNCGGSFTHLGESYVGCLENGKSYFDPLQGSSVLGQRYSDINPFESLDDQGHNYFLSRNPYVLNSYAAFGEAYYDVTKNLKLTAGLRWTDDEKHFTNYPSELLADRYGYPSTGTVDQKWNKWTGRFVANWTPKLDFTDQTMIYASYAHGYKAGGANPPGAVLLFYGGGVGSFGIPFPVHPLTFDPEFIDAYELGTKNTAFDGALTLNADVFYYDYKGYQISQIVDRTSVNINVDATVQGAELQVDWSPLPGLKFGFNGGYEDTRLKDNQYFIDLQDRTAGHPGWVLMKPWVGQSSNCILPEYVAAALVQNHHGDSQGNYGPQACGSAYYRHFDPLTVTDYSNTTYPLALFPTTINGISVPSIPYPGFDPLAGTPGDPYVGQNTANGIDYGPAPNNGEGFAKNIGGNELPNAPHFTASLNGEYTVPLSENWAATLHSDFYWQSQFWARIFNSTADKVRGYSNLNLALILNDTTGWQIMGYVKNVFDKTAITGTFLNSDDSGLTTNVFLTDPRLYGVRITKHFDTGEGGSFDLFTNSDGKRPLLWLELGGAFAQLNADNESYSPPFESLMPAGLPRPSTLEKAPSAGFDREAKLSFQPEDSDWVLKAGIRYGRSSKNKSSHVSLPPETRTKFRLVFSTVPCTAVAAYQTAYDLCRYAPYNEFEDSVASQSEKHVILDFTLGKDVGLGLFGRESQSNLAAGVRIAQFNSRADGRFNTDPEYFFPVRVKYQTHEIYNGTTQEKRSFHGIGPELTWDSNMPVWGEADSGQVAFDWGVNAAILFGRAKAKVEHQAYHAHCKHNAYCTPLYTIPETFTRSRNVTVPNLGGHAGLSVRYSNAKISFGYRADEFFGAMDGGQDTAKKYNRGFAGPYLNLSVGFGG